MGRKRYPHQQRWSFCIDLPGHVAQVKGATKGGLGDASNGPREALLQAFRADPKWQEQQDLLAQIYRVLFKLADAVFKPAEVASAQTSAKSEETLPLVMVAGVGHATLLLG